MGSDPKAMAKMQDTPRSRNEAQVQRREEVVRLRKAELNLQKVMRAAGKSPK